jgi:hypothetical protein
MKSWKTTLSGIATILGGIAGAITHLRITADGTDRTITIPSTYSLARGGNITTTNTLAAF